MQCLKPITLFHVGKVFYPDGLVVPCGKCFGCRIKKREEWSLRMLHELPYHKKSVFLTLTYSDENLPDAMSLQKRDLQNFFKRIRKNYSTPIKYFACGEYGDYTIRPHYHAIVFGLGLNPTDKELVKSCWKNCDWSVRSIAKNSFGLVEADSIRYVSQYIDKKLSGEEARDFYGDRSPVFCLQSKGLGRRYAEDNKQQIINNGYLTHNGSKNSIPRYYINRLGIDTEPLKSIAKDKQCDNVEKTTGIYISPEELYAFATSEENLLYITSEKDKREQIGLNLNAKSKLFRRDINPDQHS